MGLKPGEITRKKDNNSYLLKGQLVTDHNHRVVNIPGHHNNNNINSNPEDVFNNSSD